MTETYRLPQFKNDDWTTDHARGGMFASITLLEYGDFECRLCSGAHSVVRELLHRFGDHLRFVFRHKPLVRIHGRARLAACAAEAAGEQGKFWEMHDIFFEKERALTATEILHCAHVAGLDPSRFLSALASPRGTSRVRRDEQRAIEDAVLATPTFFINGTRYQGVVAAEAIAERIEVERGRLHPTPYPVSSR